MYYLILTIINIPTPTPPLKIAKFRSSLSPVIVRLFSSFTKNQVMTITEQIYLFFSIHGFWASLQLKIVIRYELSLKMVKCRAGVKTAEVMGTVWGFQGLPRSKGQVEEERTKEHHFRWFQVRRRFLNIKLSSQI